MFIKLCFLTVPFQAGCEVLEQKEKKMLDEDKGGLRTLRKFHDNRFS